MTRYSVLKGYLHFKGRNQTHCSYCTNSSPNHHHNCKPWYGEKGNDSLGICLRFTEVLIQQQRDFWLGWRVPVGWGWIIPGNICKGNYGWLHWLHACTEGGGRPSVGVAYFFQLQLERERNIIQGNKQAAPCQVISTFTLFPLMNLLVTPVQSM